MKCKSLPICENRSCQNTLLHMHLSSYLLQVSCSLQSTIRLANPCMPFGRRSELEARRNLQWRYRDTQVSETPLVPRTPSRRQSTEQTDPSCWVHRVEDSAATGRPERCTVPSCAGA